MWRSCSPSATCVSLHCPLNGSTRNLVDYNLLSSMKPHALLINAARSGVVVEADLARILAEGRIRRARRSTALRTTGAPKIPFLSIPAERVLLTPHLAGVTRAAFGRMLSQALENSGACCWLMASRPVSW